MYYKALKDFTFDGTAYKAGDVLDLADPELVARMQSEPGRLVLLADAPTEPEPKPEQRTKLEAKPKAEAPKVPPVKAEAKPVGRPPTKR